MHYAYLVIPFKHTHHNPRSFFFLLYGGKKAEKLKFWSLQNTSTFLSTTDLIILRQTRKLKSSVPKVGEREKSERGWVRINSSHTYLRCYIHIKNFSPCIRISLDFKIRMPLFFKNQKILKLFLKSDKLVLPVYSTRHLVSC